MKMHFLKASFTVEAALVLPLCLFCILSLIGHGIRIHEQVSAKALVNELTERLGHSRDEDDRQLTEEEIRLSGRNRLDRFDAEPYKEGSLITYSKNGNEGSMTDKGFRPEKILRAFTIIEDLTEQ